MSLPIALHGTTVNKEHSAMPDLVKDIEGWLWDEEILALYALAYAARYGVFEVGCYKGKSTTVLASGLRAAGRNVPLHCIDIKAAHIDIARRNVEAIAHYPCTFHRGDSLSVLRELHELQCDVAFIDGGHTYENVCTDIAAIAPLIERGGIMAFHDYFDARNETQEYGVVDAVTACLPKNFSLLRQCVSMAVFQRQ